MFRVGLQAFTAPMPCIGMQVRGMATLKEISMRLKSVKSIQKITKSMKMVSAAKYARAERNLRAGKATGTAASALLDKTKMKLDTTKPLVIAISSDRGLCGGVHSGVAKYIKRMTDLGESKVVIVGDKVRGILARTHKDNILVSANNYGRSPPLFLEASFVAQEVLNSGYAFSSGKIIYNKFKSAVSYEVSEKAVSSPSALEGKEELNAYDDIDADVLKSYSEFNLAATVFYTMLEAQASEQSARMSAMENATNNASDMIGTLQRTFNRTRQAVITTELIEIISGAAAME